ncbi:MAG TPA: hypothetical protein VE782_16255 [Myxococcaceae bacterium]|nr:hypothetical protein [Myxococcaceae bacterium]
MVDRWYSRWRRVGRASALWVVAGALWLAPAAWGEVVGGVQLPNGVQKVGADRYRAPENYEETLKYFRTVYPPERYPRKPIVNQPGVKAVHIENPSGKIFEGLNIYEANEGEVRIFIVRASK